MQQPCPQLRRPLRTYTREEKHPSSGGNPYSQDMREEVIAQHQLGLPTVTPELAALCQQVQKMATRGGCRQRQRQPSGRGNGCKRAMAAETGAGKAARVGMGVPAAGPVNEPMTLQNINNRQTNRGGEEEEERG